MDIVLVVEDEKAIRQGIAAMVLRSPVPVGQVLECRNGEEALEILEHESVDLVLTDLKMPKMDGAELVQRITGMSVPPLIVVISGYDEFENAVRMMRMGVRDYLLKPVDRQQLYDLLSRMEGELQQSRTEREHMRAAALQALRSLMLGTQTGDTASTLLYQSFSSLFDADYAVICLCVTHAGLSLPQNVIDMGEIQGEVILLCGGDTFPLVRRGLLDGVCAGFSAFHRGADSLHTAYKEAVQARHSACLRGYALQYTDHLPLSEKENPGQAEQIVQLLGAGKAQSVRRILSEWFLRAQNGKTSPDAFCDALSSLLDRVESVYSRMPGIIRELGPFRDLWQYETAFDYYEALGDWIDRFCQSVLSLEENAGQKKIEIAVEYLRRHFALEIDMAVVSNQVSMNYSQFSGLFKKYTGSNFQTYLRTLRLEEGQRLLRDTNLSIRQISEQAGFKNEKHFMKIFKQALAVSPTDYRRNMRRTDSAASQAEKEE